MVQEGEGLHDCKDQGEGGQEGEGWVQASGEEPPGGEQIDSKADEE